MTETDLLLASLTKQQQLLTKILGSLDKPQLGFHDNGGIVYVYCNRQYNSFWYTLDRDRQPQSIVYNSLTGYLRQLKFEKVERRGQECHKLITTIRADKLYCLESGYDSHFSKGLLSAIASLAPQQLLQPVTLQPQMGEDKSVLFCRLWVGSELGSELVKVTYGEETDWRETAKAALAVVKAATEMSF